VVVQATDVLPFDLKGHYQVVASPAGRGPERALCIQLLYQSEQLPGLGLRESLHLSDPRLLHIWQCCNPPEFTQAEDRK